jgi:hypothetical protein
MTLMAMQAATIGLLKNVMSAGKTRQNSTKKRSLF